MDAMGMPGRVLNGGRHCSLGIQGDCLLTSINSSKSVLGKKEKTEEKKKECKKKWTLRAFSWKILMNSGG